MKLRSRIAAVLTAAGVILASGCSGDFNFSLSGIDGGLFNNGSDSGNTSSDTSSSGGYSNGGSGSPAGNTSSAVSSGGDVSKTVLDGGTTISRINGDLEIARLDKNTGEKNGGYGWTILVYMCGADLESVDGAATDDLIEAMEAQYSENVNFIVQTGGASYWQNDLVEANKIQRLALASDGYYVADERSVENMGNAETLADFVEWGARNYPAEKMGLVLWDHGSGSIHGVCFDENYGNDSLSLREIDDALSSVYSCMPDKFEFIGFDACLMATLETANLTAPYARYMYASEESEPGSGWDYTAIMNLLASDPGADGEELGETLCESYFEHCGNQRDTATFSVVDLSKIDRVITEFDEAARELYYGGRYSDIARVVFENVDSFGARSQWEGYSNMVDLAGFLRKTSSIAPSASRALDALDDAVICLENGDIHENAGGLAMYYPLAVQGSEELSVFRDVCTSTYYLALVDKIAYGTTGGDPLGYDNSYLTADTADINEIDASFSSDIGSNNGEFDNTGDSGCPFVVEDLYFNSDGVLTVDLDDFNEVLYATCTVLMDDGYGSLIFLGEDDEVIYDYDRYQIQDNFTGDWVCLNGYIMPIEFMYKTENESVFSCSVLLNGVAENLLIIYDWDYQEWYIYGVWGGMDSETGMAYRSSKELYVGDIIQPIYYYIDDYGEDYFLGDEIELTNDYEIIYQSMPAADYYYSITIYDVYGNSWYTDYVTFTIDEDGELWYDETELA